MSNLLRNGRLTNIRNDIIQFTSSAIHDKHIIKNIIDINMAHIAMLIETKIISLSEGKKILGALYELSQSSSLELNSKHEDGHMFVEEEVSKATGEKIGSNINLAKSRNDQVSTAIRMNLRNRILDVVNIILQLQQTLVDRSKKDGEIIIPAYTHMQPAQPTSFSHYLFAYSASMNRSIDRLKEAYARVDECPMGAGALTTTSFPIDRKRVGGLLGFGKIMENSIDSVGTRDFLLEVMAVLSIMAVDVTRFVEDMIFWSSPSVGTLELPDEFSFTSSIMPQKKNPDVLEIIRARMTKIIGIYNTSTTMMKALPYVYNIDFQEVTPLLWETIETTESCLSMFQKILKEISVNQNSINKNYLTFLGATELSNMLVKDHKIPFRIAHKIIGSLVRELILKNKSLNDTTPDMLEKISKRLLQTPIILTQEEITNSTNLLKCVEANDAYGGTSKKRLREMLVSNEKKIIIHNEWVELNKKYLEKTQNKLRSVVTKYLK